MRVALYARVSTAEEKELQDPETQLMILRDYCKIYGHEITATYVDHCSGKDPNRPEFSKMMKAAKLKSRPFDIIICLRIDRLHALRSLRAAGDAGAPRGKVRPHLHKESDRHHDRPRAVLFHRSTRLCRA